MSNLSSSTLRDTIIIDDYIYSVIEWDNIIRINGLKYTSYMGHSISNISDEHLSLMLLKINKNTFDIIDIKPILFEFSGSTYNIQDVKIKSNQIKSKINILINTFCDNQDTSIIYSDSGLTNYYSGVINTLNGTTLIEQEIRYLVSSVQFRLGLTNNLVVYIHNKPGMNTDINNGDFITLKYMNYFNGRYEIGDIDYDLDNNVEAIYLTTTIPSNYSIYDSYGVFETYTEWDKEGEIVLEDQRFNHLKYSVSNFNSTDTMIITDIIENDDKTLLCRYKGVNYLQDNTDYSNAIIDRDSVPLYHWNFNELNTETFAIDSGSIGSNLERSYVSFDNPGPSSIINKSVNIDYSSSFACYLNSLVSNQETIEKISILFWLKKISLLTIDNIKHFYIYQRGDLKIYLEARDYPPGNNYKYKIICDMGELSSYMLSTPSFFSEWTHISITIETELNEMKWYFDGVLVETSILNYQKQNFTTSDFHYIGNSNQQLIDNNLDGFLADFRIYDNILDNDNINDIYVSGEGTYNIFNIKYITQVPSSSSNETGPLISELVTDESNNYYSFGLGTNFNGGTEIQVGDYSPINPSIMKDGSDNILIISKFNSNKNTIWNSTVTLKAGTIINNPKMVYSDNEVYMTFIFSGEVQVGSKTYTTPTNIMNSVGVKIDIESGLINHSKMLGSDKYNAIKDIIIDDEYVYILGEFKGEAVFDELRLFATGQSGYLMKSRKLDGMILNVVNFYADEKLNIVSLGNDSENIYISGSWKGNIYINDVVKYSIDEEFFITNIKKNDL